MKAGDLAWHTLREGWRVVTILEIRHWRDNMEWVQILDDGEIRWTAASLIRGIDESR